MVEAMPQTGDKSRKHQQLFLRDLQHQPSGNERNHQGKQARSRDQHLHKADIDIRIMFLDLPQHRGYAELQPLHKGNGGNREI